MTNTLENLLEKIEEKMVPILSEVEDLRKRNHLLLQEIASLKNKEEANTKKLQEIMLLLETVTTADNIPATAPAMQLIQGQG